MKPLTLAVFSIFVASAASAASASPLEQAVSAARLQFQSGFTISGLRVLAAEQAGVVAAVAGAQAAPADVAREYFKAGKPKAAELLGWYSGRRKTSAGWVAAVLVGVEISRTDAGPIEGSDHKVLFFGPDKPGIIPADVWDNLGSAAEDAITMNVREKNGEWAALDLQDGKPDEGAVSAKGSERFELRSDGRWIYVRYPSGDFGYFFKKIR